MTASSRFSHVRASHTSRKRLHKFKKQAQVHRSADYLTYTHTHIASISPTT